MTTEKFDQIESLFTDALEMARPSRAAYLEKACEGDTELLQEVITLLENFESACEYFDHFELELAEVADPDENPLEEGSRIGPYEIGAKIGSGGMSVVYQAKRVGGSYEETVAIKVLKKGLDTTGMLSRFRKEQQLLANLRHPAIANLLDGGETPSGQSYLVMEYIEGLPLDKAIQAGKYDQTERLQLFLQIIAAVQHAHSRLVVHRDIKPGNILLSPQAQVKLLDFGIAKLIDSPAPEEETQVGQRLFTPHYAAPEQIAGEPVSTATDVYQLGLLMSEILADEQLDADLRLILEQARRADPERRYTTAGDLGRDIEAYLSHRPITARPESWGYLARKFVMRNRLGVVATVLVLLSLLGGIIGTSWQATRATAALKREILAREKAEQISSFLVYLFESADPYERQDSISGKDMTLEVFLAQSLPTVREELKEQPELQLELLEILGKLYARLSMKQESYDIGKEVLMLTERAEGKDATAFADRSLLLAGVALDLDRFAEADSLFLLTAEAHQRIYGTRPRHLSVVYNDYGILKYTIGQPKEADSLYREALAIMQLNDIPDTANYAQTLNNQAQALMALGRNKEAYEAVSRSSELQFQAGLDQSIFMAHTQNRMASLLVNLDSLEQALILQKKALEGFEKFLGRQSHFYALGHYQLSKIHQQGGDYERQEQAIRQAMEILAEIYGTKHVNYGVCLSALGTSLRHQQKYESALRAQQQAFDIFDGLGIADKAATCLMEETLVLMEEGKLSLATGRWEKELSLFETTS